MPALQVQSILCVGFPPNGLGRTICGGRSSRASRGVRALTCQASSESWVWKGPFPAAGIAAGRRTLRAPVAGLARPLAAGGVRLAGSKAALVNSVAGCCLA